MFRKLVLTLAATAALGTAALTTTSTPAAAWKGGFHGHHHHHHHGHWRGGFRFYTPAHVGYRAYDSCLRRRVVATPWGLRTRWVNVCY